MAKKKKPKPTGLRRRCFLCDGTGHKCNNCGESEAACDCEDAQTLTECDSCGGIGIAILDQTDAEREIGKAFVTPGDE